LESELFGYMKGAFTGAQNNRKGLLESANGGSIFLDEIGDMTLPMQVKLLRVLQERKLRPLGGTSEVAIDVRVIAATNRDLKEAIGQGQFRSDLYYRIAVITIMLPPLRERVEDIELLVSHFREEQAKKAHKKISGISLEALQRLQTYKWPGNIRELENAIERAIALTPKTTEIIQIDHLPDVVRGFELTTSPQNRSFEIPEGSFDIEVYMSTIERSLICRALEFFNGNQTLAAQHLKLTKPSLRHKLQALGIDPGNFKRTTSG
jgi:transcriptional regulator with PAS, ATPase and Fis domain